MSTRRKVGVSTATTESARRQLMAPVACWERQWVKPDASANFKVYKWVKTDKRQVGISPVSWISLYGRRLLVTTKMMQQMRYSLLYQMNRKEMKVMMTWTKTILQRLSDPTPLLHERFLSL